MGSGGGNIDRTGTGAKIDRVYYASGDIAKAITRAKLNQAAGMRTWMSFKMPGSWAAVAAGTHDAWVKDVYAKLDALNFQVWVTFHHEPENDGVMPDWRKMQARLASMVPGGVNGDIKFWLIMTGWHQEDAAGGAANKWEALYPTGSPIYGIAYDQPYPQYGYVWVNGVKTTEFRDGARTEGAVYIDKLADRAAAYGVKAAIGEYGFSDEHYTLDKTWLNRTVAAARNRGLLALCYFDTTLNSTKSWTLGSSTSAKRQHYNGVTK